MDTPKTVNRIPHETLLKHLTSPASDALGEINDIKLDALPINDNDELTWDDYSGHVSWTVAFIVIALVAVVIYKIFLLYRHKLIIPIMKRDQSCVTDTDDTPAAAVSPVTTPRQSVIFSGHTGLVSLPTDWHSLGTTTTHPGNNEYRSHTNYPSFTPTRYTSTVLRNPGHVVK